MFCPQCGSNNEEVARFCEECGTGLNFGKQNIAIQTSLNSNIVSTLRHPKETLYFTIAAIVGVFAWFGLIWLVILLSFYLIPLLIGLFIFEMKLRTRLLGNSIKISKEQYPEINDLIEKNCRALRLSKHPDVFVINSEGAINAVALKILRGRYILLFSELIDTMSGHKSNAELDFIIAHELAHHAAGHTSIWRRLLLIPSMLIPFFYSAYSRSCELTADRMGAYLCGSKAAAGRALVTFACGSYSLAPKTNLEAFKNQETQLNKFFAFLGDLYASHPRITKRFIELENAAHLFKT